MDKLRIDGQKLEFHPHRVAQWLDGRNDWEKAKHIYPLYIEVSPMGACNHRCTFCAVDYIGYKTVQLDADVMAERFAEMGALGVKSIMFAGEGEPLLHKRINDMVCDCVEAGIDVAFTTNGVLLDKLTTLPACEWVKISLNAGTAATYAKVHRTKEKDWDAVWENIRDAVKRKGACTIGVQMVVLPENEHEAPLLQALCDEAGVDYCVFKPYSQHKMSITRQYEGYKPINLPAGKRTVIREEAIKTEGHAYEKCSATPYLWSYVMASGDVYSCSAYLLDDRFRLGNLGVDSFQSIWQGEKRRANWTLVKDTLDIKECRVNCRMDKANRYLAGFDTQEHVNFV
jgi:GTP 3',8-cyclase